MDLNNRHKCVVSGYDCIFFFVADETFCMSRINEIVTHCGHREERGRIDEERRVQIFAGNKVEGNQDFPVKVRFSPLHVTSSKRIRI